MKYISETESGAQVTLDVTRDNQGHLIVKGSNDSFANGIAAIICIDELFGPGHAIMENHPCSDGTVYFVLGPNCKAYSN